MVQVQAPIQLDDLTMPEPDIAVIRRRSINDLAPVLPSDVYLLVEVADSSLEFDLGEKLARYAAAGIRPEAWVANLRAGELVVNTDLPPEWAVYENLLRYPAGWHGKPASFPDLVSRVGGFYSCPTELTPEVSPSIRRARRGANFGRRRSARRPALTPLYGVSQRLAGCAFGCL